MKSLFLFFGFHFLTAGALFSQARTPFWTQTTMFQHDTTIWIRALAADAEDNLFLSHEFSSPNQIVQDVSLLRFDRDRQLVYKRILGARFGDIATGLIPLQSGRVFYFGTTEDSTGTFDFRQGIFEPNGEATTWHRVQTEVGRHEEGIFTKQISDRIFSAGYSITPEGSHTLLTISRPETGDFLQTTFVPERGGSSFPVDIIQLDIPDRFVLSESVSFGPAGERSIVTVFDSAGNRKRSVYSDLEVSAEGHSSAAALANGRFFIAGTVNNKALVDVRDTSLALLKRTILFPESRSFAQHIEWAHRRENGEAIVIAHETQGFRTLYRWARIDEGGTVVARDSIEIRSRAKPLFIDGSLYLADLFGAELRLFRVLETGFGAPQLFEFTGVLNQWRIAGGTDGRFYVAIQLAEDRGYTLAAFTLSGETQNENGGPDQQKNHFELKKLFPNPFNPNAVLQVTLNAPGHLEMSVFDVTGRILLNRNPELSRGNHSLPIDATGWSAGVYLIQVRMGNQVEMRKAVLVK